jgi:DNA-binding PadR family transcriptional regulator
VPAAEEQRRCRACDLPCAYQVTGYRGPVSRWPLYAALDRLTAEGLVEQDHDEVVDGRLRRYYRLTDQGAQRLSEATARMRSNVRTAEKRLPARNPRLAGGAA